MSCIDIRIPGNIVFSDLAQRIIEDFSRCAGMTVKDSENVGLAGREAFINAVKHGCGMNCSKKIKIKLSIKKDLVAVEITDPGKGFNPNNIDDPTKPENRMKSRGRGLLIMKTYSDKTVFKKLKDNKGMRVTIYKSIPLAKGRCTR